MVGLINGFKETVSDSFFGNVRGIIVDNVYDEYVRQKAINKIQSENIEYYESNDYDLSILLDCPSIKYIHISREATLTILNRLPNIKGIQINGLYGENENYDFSQLTALKFLSINGPGKNDSFLKNDCLERLCLMDYRKKDLSEFQNMKSLKKLEISLSSKLQSLENLQQCQNLKDVVLSYCQNLINIDALGCLNNLESVTIERCLKIESLCCFEKNKKLKSLSFIDCSKSNYYKILPSLENLENLEFIEITGAANTINSLDFISKMPNLKTFSTNYKLKVKDKSPLHRLEGIYISEQ